MSSEVPLVSVVVPSYNHARYLPDLLSSLVAQTWPRIELVLIDDGSTDSSVVLLESERARLEAHLERVVIRHRENRGVAATQNELLGLATGSLVFFCASDDRLFSPETVAQLADALRKNKDAILACGDARFIDSEGRAAHLDPSGQILTVPTQTSHSRFLEHMLRGRTWLQTSPDFGKHYTLLRGNYMPVGALMRHGAVSKALPYPSGLVLEDLHFWMKLSRFGRFICIPAITMDYRVHSTNVSRTRQQRMRKEHVRMLIEQSDYCAETNRLAEWQDAVEQVLSLRDPSEVLAALRAGLSVRRFIATRARAHLHRIGARIRGGD